MTYPKPHSILVFSLALTAMTACTERGEPPSLAKRPFETAAAPTPPIPIAPSASDPVRAARIAQFREQARKGKSLFDENVPVTERAVASAKGAAVGTEAWIAAQLALSRLESFRGAAQTALANLDNERRLLMDDLPSDDEQGLNRAQQEIEDISDRQAEKIALLAAILTKN